MATTSSPGACRSSLSPASASGCACCSSRTCWSRPWQPASPPQAARCSPSSRWPSPFRDRALIHEFGHCLLQVGRRRPTTSCSAARRAGVVPATPHHWRADLITTLGGPGAHSDRAGARRRHPGDGRRHRGDLLQPDRSAGAVRSGLGLSQVPAGKAGPDTSCGRRTSSTRACSCSTCCW